MTQFDRDMIEQSLRLVAESQELLRETRKVVSVLLFDKTKTNISTGKPADAEVEHSAIELAKADGLAWAGPGTPAQGEQGQLSAATNKHREKYRKLAQERLDAEQDRSAL